MRFMESLENMESSVEKNLENIENPDYRSFQEETKQDYDFDKLLQGCFNSCQVLGDIKAMGDNVDDAINIEIDYLNNLLLKSGLSLEDREEIINKAYSLMGIDNVF